MQFLQERMGKSFEHTVTAGAWGASGMKILWQHDQVKFKILGI